MGRGRKKPKKKPFVTLTMQAYLSVGGQFDRDLAAQCAYYPRVAFGRVVCANCTFDYPKESCKRAHIMQDTNLRRCELCHLVDDNVILVEHHTLHPACLERVLQASREATERSEDA